MFSMLTDFSKLSNPSFIDEFYLLGKESFEEIGFAGEYAPDVQSLIKAVLLKNVIIVEFRSNGALVGYQLWAVYHDFFTPSVKRAMLRSIFMKKNYRNKSVFVDFLDFGISSVKSLGASKVTIGADAGTRFDKVVSALGFKVCSKEYEV